MGIQKYANQHCPALCENIEYDLRVPKMGENAMSTLSKNQTLFFVRYASQKVKVEEEYTLMGTNAIISATGGSLGLFLGFSCYGTIMSVFGVIKKFFNC